VIAVVTGATGLLGGNLAEALIQAGWRVRGTRRRSSHVDHLADLGIEWVEARLDDPDALARAFDAASLVFHCAANLDIARNPTRDQLEANVLGTRRVIAAARRAGVRLIHCSSTVAVGVSDDERPCTETQRWNIPERGLADGYAITKRQSEEEVAAAREVDRVIVNPGYMLGPRDARPSSGRMILEVARRRLVAGPPGFNSFVDVRDVARGMISAATRGRRGERYILAGENVPYTEAFARIAHVVGGRPPRFPLPRGPAVAGGWLGDLTHALTGRSPRVTSTMVRWGFERGFQMDSSKARAELGYATRPWEEGVEAAWKWFRQRAMV
jgi:dihydroflavonol-4-reductase